MKLTAAVVGALASLASAHNDPREVHAGIPKLVGARRFLSEMKASNAVPAALNLRAEHNEKRHLEADENLTNLQPRANSNKRCGPNLGTCVSTECCSADG
jgi:hypothetical protein